MRSRASSLERTAPRFRACEDITFAKEVLLLDGRSEDDLDAELNRQAIELGVDIRQQPETPPVSEPSSSRYSTSIDSRISISTARSGASVYSYDTRQSTASSLHSAGSIRSHKSTFARIKGLGLLLRTSRSNLKPCPHCPRDVASQRRALHALPCGDRLCTQALRNVVLESIKDDLAPACCGRTIPDRFVRHVLTGDEVMRYEGCSKGAIADSGPAATPTPLSPSSAVSSRHTAESARFDVWVEKQRSIINAQRAETVRLLEVQHQKSLDAQLEARAKDMATAEDRQVKAEADLRHLHQQEIRDNATALKHMEAYCAGTTASGAPHDRSITEQDLVELRKARAIRGGMQQRHSNAVNILRGEQSRRMKLRSQRHDQDRHDLEFAHCKEVLAIEQRHQLEEVSLAEDCAKRRRRLEARYQLQDLIETRKAAKHVALPGNENALGPSPSMSIAEPTVHGNARAEITLSEFLASSAVAPLVL